MMAANSNPVKSLFIQETSSSIRTSNRKVDSTCRDNSTGCSDGNMGDNRRRGKNRERSNNYCSNGVSRDTLG